MSQRNELRICWDDEDDPPQQVLLALLEQQHRHHRHRIIVPLTIRTPSFTARGVHMDVRIPDNQKVNFSYALNADGSVAGAVDVLGNPANPPVVPTGPGVWTVSDPTKFTPAPSADGLSCDVTPAQAVGMLGTAILTLSIPTANGPVTGIATLFSDASGVTDIPLTAAAPAPI